MKIIRRVSNCLTIATAWRCLEFSPTTVWTESRRYRSTNARSSLMIPTSSDPLQALKASITTAQDNVRRRQADVAAVTSYLAAPKNGRPSKPLDPDATTRVLWNEGTWTTRRLRDAEQRLRDAKQDLRDAEQRLRDAKQDLQRSPPVDLRALLDSFVSACSHVAVQLPSKQITRRCGGIAVQQQIFDTFKAGKRNVMQHSVALALRGASGVGKTYLALSYPTGPLRTEYKKRNWRHVCVYAGFNSDCPLTGEEHDFFETKKCKGEMAVGLVVLARVVGQLEAFLAGGCPQRPDDEDVHMLARQISTGTLLGCPLHQLGLFIGMLQTKIVEQLKTIHKKCGCQKTMVLINLDEAQFLDTYFDDGARYGLRTLRKLQIKVENETNGAVVVVGLATGIDPELSLLQATTGQNIVVSKELMTRDEFIDLALNYKNKNWMNRLERTRRLMIAERFYPRVRHMLHMVLREPTDLTVDIRLTRSQANTLIKHHIKQKPLEYTAIPVGCPVTCCDLLCGVPYVDAMIWKSLLLLFHLPLSVIPYDLTNTATSDCYAFEDHVRRILYFVLVVFFGTSRTLKAAAAAYRTKHQYLEKALGLSGQQLRVHFGEYRLNNPHAVHPFANRSKTNLSSEMNDAILLLKHPGDAVLLHLGIHSPVDYMLLWRNDQGRIKVWYGDAKTHKKNDAALVVADMKTFKTTVGSLHRRLRKLIPRLSSTYSSSIITNVDVEVNKQPLFDKKHTVLCPSTFVCEPWTSILYRELDVDSRLKKLPTTTVTYRYTDE